MDPMCGWCYGFQPELDEFLECYPASKVDWIMGGLAPDTKEPMDEHLKHTIASYWHQIEEKTRVSFNHDFWERNTPYRSTYAACRAVISAETINAGSAQSMVKAIQSAYYLEAKNPALDATLFECAKAIGLDPIYFSEAYTAIDTEERFQQHLMLTRQLRVNGFPALFYISDNNDAYPLTLGFCEAGALNTQLELVQSDIRKAEA